MTQEEKKHEFDFLQSVKTTLSHMGYLLTNAGHTWTHRERDAYDWAARSLTRRMEELI